MLIFFLFWAIVPISNIASNIADYLTILWAILLNNQQYCWISNITGNLVSNNADSAILLISYIAGNIADNIAGNTADSAILLAILPAIFNKVLYVPARVALGVTTLLAISTTMASIQVNYDLWVKVYAFPHYLFNQLIYKQKS